MTWIGWLWIHGRWLDVCQGRSMTVCSRRLAEEAQARGIVGNTKRALTGGSRPTWTPRGKAPPAGLPGPQDHASGADASGAGLGAPDAAASR